MRTKPGANGLRTGPLVAPSVVVLFVWMAVPLGMTVYFSLVYFNLLNPDQGGFVGLANYTFLFEDPAFWTSMAKTLILVGSILLLTVTLGTLLAVLYDEEFFGRSLSRLLLIAPFFVMPTVAGLVWKNLLMHPVNGVFAWLAGAFGMMPVDWLSDLPMTSLVLIVSWMWIPFAFLILLTSLQSLDQRQVEAARIDGAGPIALFYFVTLPHLRRAISVVVMIETIFLLSIFAEIYVTTSGGPGIATTTLSYLIFLTGLLHFDVGAASAAGLIAVVLANVVAFFMIKTVSRTL
jgi:sorbitol/mannitol transport system permease protein